MTAAADDWILPIIQTLRFVNSMQQLIIPHADHVDDPRDTILVETDGSFLLHR